MILKGHSPVLKACRRSLKGVHKGWSANHTLQLFLASHGASSTTHVSTGGRAWFFLSFHTVGILYCRTQLQARGPLQLCSPPEEPETEGVNLEVILAASTTLPAALGIPAKYQAFTEMFSSNNNKRLTHCIAASTSLLTSSLEGRSLLGESILSQSQSYSSEAISRRTYKKGSSAPPHP